MSTFGRLLGLKTGADSDTAATGPNQTADGAVEFDEELFRPIVSQLGEANERVRNLLVDAGAKIDELQTIKQTFDKLVDPVANTLRAIEEEKTKNINLQSLLGEARAANTKLRAEAANLGKKATSFEAECARFRQDLVAAQQSLHEAELSNADQAAELAARRLQITDLERHLLQETKEQETAREKNRGLSERLADADRRIVALESDINMLRQNLQVAEQEKVSLRTSLDQTYNESARISRRVLEAENALAVMQTRMRQTETNLAEASAERARLAGALDEANERHQNESTTLRLRLETLQSRAATTDKLLDEAREASKARAEELSSYERRLAEATFMRSTIESKLSEIAAAHGAREAQFKELEQAHAKLSGNAATVARALRTRDNMQARSEERVQQLNDRVYFLEVERDNTRLSMEKHLEELNSTLQRERMERTLAEGALESARKDLARVRRDQAAARMRKTGANDSEPPPAKGFESAA
jgi:crescentin